MRAALLANWGLGQAALLEMARLPFVRLAWVATQWDPASRDPWRNAVWQSARELGLPVYCAGQTGQDRLAQLAAGLDCLVVHAYMKKIGPALLAAPRLGVLNLHPSLLPKHRGPSPTHWVVANGEGKTGLSAHMMDEGLDTGPLVHQVEILLKPGAQVADIIDMQREAAPELLREALKRLLDPGFRPTPQDHSAATWAPKP